MATDILSFQAGGVQFTLDLTFAGKATSGVIQSISGSVGSDPITQLNTAFQAPDNTLSTSSPYVDFHGISFDTASGGEFNFFYNAALASYREVNIGGLLGDSFRTATDVTLTLPTNYTLLIKDALNFLATQYTVNPITAVNGPLTKLLTDLGNNVTHAMTSPTSLVDLTVPVATLLADLYAKNSITADNTTLVGVANSNDHGFHVV